MFVLSCSSTLRNSMMLTRLQRMNSLPIHRMFSTGILSFTSLPPAANEKDKPLRDDVKDLGKILGDSIRQDNPQVFQSVETLRRLGRKWRAPAPEGDRNAFQEMVKEVQNYETTTLLGVARSFSNFLGLANSAENHHRLRRLKNDLLKSDSQYGLWLKEDSCAGSIQRLKKDGISPATITSTLFEQKVEIVLTAHPTEVNRRTMLRKHRHIQEILTQIDRKDLSNYERKVLNGRLRSEITGIWESDNLRRTQPTPIDEARSGLTMVEHVFWDAVPNFLRKLDYVVKGELGTRLPIDYSPIQISSWMGGDRDGNPNVTPEITLEVSMLARWTAATLFKADITHLRGELSIRSSSEELREKVGSEAREPYRAVLRQLLSRLQATIDWTTNNITKKQFISASAWNADSKNQDARPITKKSELLEPLQLIHRSLLECGLQTVAEGSLLDTIRRVAAFGAALSPIDIRQESTRHSEALDAITKFLGVGSYLQWDETTRRNWLSNELSSKRPLLPRNADYQALGFSSTVIDTLRTFQVAAFIERESLGAYVISQCQQASDILAVALLQQDAGVSPIMRVVPLFETLDDLTRAKDTVDALFSIPTYRGRIQNKQEIMVGYSDSAKDAGRIAASWAQYNSQIAMAEVAKKHGVELTFFHGKGGTVGRGGNPALFQAILAHPPETINGRFRVTEQGEMITQNFGQVPIAERTFDVFTAAVLTERFISRPRVKPEWAAAMETLSEVSCEAYRKIVRVEPRFVPYFRTATPETELAGLNVGSRPAKRNPKGGVDSLRAIPWNFAWTQTRLNLPTWLGVGEAFEDQLKKNPLLLKEMFTKWPWFATLVDLLEMILIKSDSIIAENYDHQLVTDEASKILGHELREKLVRTASAVLAVSGNTSLQSNNELLLRSLAVRNPYIDPLNVIQAEVLKRLREDDQRKHLSNHERIQLQDTLLVTINGIANGMRNSG